MSEVFRPAGYGKVFYRWLNDIIENRLDLKKGKMELYRFLYGIGRRFTANRLKIMHAIYRQV